jgi:hypothetical protein
MKITTKCEGIKSSVVDCRGNRMRCEFNATLPDLGHWYCRYHHPPTREARRIRNKRARDEQRKEPHA